MKLSLDHIDALVFDFDGVLKDNTVFLNEDGKEWVRCNRGDGLAFNDLEKLGVKSYIISSETNKVVLARANKLNVPALCGISNKVVVARANKLNIPALIGITNKVEELQKLCASEGLDLSRVFYIGNDLNDFQAMKICGFSACPADSHPKIKEIATFKLNTNGGMGIVREILEDLLKQDIMTTVFRDI